MSEWKPLLDPFQGGYVKGFDRNKEYEFRRHNEERVSRYCMADQHPAFNVWGLYWREVTDQPQE